MGQPGAAVKRVVEVTISSRVEVELDESFFTEKWMAGWRVTFYPFRTVEEHVEHITRLAARDMLNPNFTEGYGLLSSMGIKASVLLRDIETEIKG
jgi:hypothetical protein